MLRQRRYRTVGYGDDANVTAGSERHDVDRQAGIAGKANANQHILLIELSKLVNRITAARIDKADRSNHPAEVMIECKRKTEGTSKTQNVRFPGPSHQCNSLIETSRRRAGARSQPNPSSPTATIARPHSLERADLRTHPIAAPDQGAASDPPEARAATPDSHRSQRRPQTGRQSTPTHRAARQCAPLKVAQRLRAATKPIRRHADRLHSTMHWPCGYGRPNPLTDDLFLS